jgi:protein gp37
MGKDSQIEWCHHTFNPWWGCTKVSDGCKFCYADLLANRWGHDVWGPKAMRRKMADAYWKQPFAWDRAAAAAGERHRVFCASMADVFEGPETCQDADAYAMIERERLRLFDMIRQTPNLDWLLLTKRPENVNGQVCDCRDIAERRNPLDESQQSADLRSLAHMLNQWANGKPPANVWLGTSVENQKAADERIPELLKIPAVVRFLSCEPLLGAVDLTVLRKYNKARLPWIDALRGHTTKGRLPISPDHCGISITVARTLPKIDWVIIGGESGHSARPMHVDWVRSLRDQCVEADVPVFFKQWGCWIPQSQLDPSILVGKSQILDYDGTLRPTSTANDPVDDPSHVACVVYPVSKKTAGRVLDGRTWDQFPEVAA